MEQKVITASSPTGLNALIKKHIKEGWEPVGYHTGLAVRSQLKYAGGQHVATQHTAEYCQTMRRHG
jgi:hypothetical protein